MSSEPLLRPPTSIGLVPAFGVRARLAGFATTHRSLILAIGAVLGFWAIAAAIWPLGGSVVPWDSKNQFYAFQRFVGDALSDGELPLWNPYHFSGHPSSADPQSLLFTPTMLLFGWLVPKPSMELFDLVVFAHLLPGALAMLGLFHRRGWRLEGGCIAAFVFILGGSASARLQHTGIILGYGFLPLALLLLEEALDRRSWRYSAAFALVACLMVIGRDQVAFLAGVSLIVLVVYEAASSGRPFGYLRERLGLFALMVAVAVVLLAVPVILTAQFLATSTRPAFGFGVAAMGSLPPESFATLLFADVYGSLHKTYDYFGPDWHSLAEGTWTDRATNYLFVGTVPIVLVLWHGIAGGRLFAREFRYFLIVGVAVTIYGLGRYTPAFAMIFDSLPGVDLYRRPADSTFLINVGLALSAGYLVHRYLGDGAPRLSDLRHSALAAARLGFAIAMVASATVVALVMAAQAHQIGGAVLEVAIGIGFAVLVATLLVRGEATARSRTVAIAVLLAATAGELVWRNAASPLNAEPADRYSVFRTLPPEQQTGLEVLRRELAARHAKGERPRVEILGLNGAWQNASMVLGLEDTIGYNPLRLADYEKAVGPGENAVDPNLRQFPGTFRGYRCRLAGLLGLEYLVLDRPLERLPKHFPRLKDAKQLYGSASMYIYQVGPSSPRAYLATHLIPVDSEAVLSAEELPAFDRSTEALVDRSAVEGLEGDYGLRDDSPEPSAANGSVSITAYGRNAVSLEVNTDRNGLVVLHDIFYPGWVATVDGKPARIVRTNLLFRGVEVGAGRHRIEFRFEPLSLRNLVLAASGLLHRGDDDGADAAGAKD